MLIRALLLTLLLASHAWSAIYYVAKTGNDSTGDGSEGNPWLTIQKAANEMVAGDRTYVKVGTYTEQGFVGSPPPKTPTVQCVNSGTPGNPIIFSAYPGDTVNVSSTNDGQAVIGNGSTSIHYIIWEGFTVTRTAPTSGTRPCAYVAGTGCEIRYCELIGSGTNSSGTATFCGVKIENATNCTIHHNVMRGFLGPNENSCGTILFISSGVSVEDNYIHTCHTGTFDKDGSAGCIYRRNYYGDNTSKGFSGNNQGVDANPEIYDNVFDDQIHTRIRQDGTKIYNNLIRSTSGTRTLFTNATGVDTLENFEIYNNVVLYSSPIVWQSGWARSGNEFNLFDYNVYVSNDPRYWFSNGSDNKSFAQMQALGFETNSDKNISQASIYDGSWVLQVAYRTAGNTGGEVGPRASSFGVAAGQAVPTILDTTRYGPTALAEDVTAPTVSSRVIPASGSQLTVTFNETCVGDEELGWTVSASGGACTVVSGSNSGTMSWSLILSRTIQEGETVTLAYSSSTGNVRNQADLDLVTFGAAAVTNNSEQTAGGGGGGDEGYDTITVTNPPGALTDFTHIIQLGDMSSEWWAAVDDDGSDIRVTKGDDTQVPCDVIRFVDGSPGSGIIAVKWSSTLASSGTQQYKVSVGTGDALPAVDSEFGQYAAYNSGWRAFWPSGLGNDRTSFGNHLTPVGSPTVGGTAGPIDGSIASDLVTSQYGTSTVSVPNAAPWSFFGSGNSDTDTARKVVVAVGTSDASSESWYLSFNGSATGDPIELFVDDGASGTDFTRTSTGYTTGAYYRAAAVINSNTDRHAFVGGGSKGSDTSSLSPDGATTIVVGAEPDTFGQTWDGDLSLISIHTVGRSDDWVAYDANMLSADDPDQDSFYTYGGWTLTASGDTEPPIVDTVTVSTDGTEIEVVYSENVSGTEEGGWTLGASGGALTVSSATGTTTDTHTFTLSRTVGSHETLTWSYSPGDLVDDGDNPLGQYIDQSVTNSSTVDTLPPAVVGEPTVPSAGTTIVITTSENVSGTEENGWTITSDGGAITVASGAGSGSTTLTLTTSRTILVNEMLDIEYNSATGDLVDGGMNDLASFTVMVENGSTQVPPAPVCVIDSNGGGPTAEIHYNEGATSTVTTVTVTDPDEDTPAFSISGGADAAKFAIDSATGVLTPVAALNYESPTDANTDGVYDIIVRATDDDGFDEQTISIMVENVAPSFGFDFNLRLRFWLSLAMGLAHVIHSHIHSYTN
jgi:hypothetical protein